MEIYLGINYKIKDLPIIERPKEKALRYGIETLSDIELFAIILNSGYKNKNVLQLAHEIYYQNGGLINVISMDYERLISIKGINKNKALLLKTIFEFYKRINVKNSFYLYKDNLTYLTNKYQNLLNNKNQELVFIILLNYQNKIVNETLIYQGSEKYVYVSSQEIIKFIKKERKSKFILLHNHIENYPYPSDEDILFTYELKNKAKKEKILLVDHIVIYPNGYFSFLENQI